MALDPVSNGALGCPLVTGGKPMDRTNAERQRRYIAKLKARAGGVTNASADPEIAKLRQELAQAQAEIAALTAALEEAGAALAQAIAALKAERQAAAPAAKRPPLSPEEKARRAAKTAETRALNKQRWAARRRADAAAAKANRDRQNKIAKLGNMTVDRGATKGEAAAAQAAKGRFSAQREATFMDFLENRPPPLPKVLVRKKPRG
jgi:hypothetical protein